VPLSTLHRHHRADAARRPHAFAQQLFFRNDRTRLRPRRHRPVELDERWRAQGLARPFNARIGINTGFVNVGNFGSGEQMDYTIVGAAANLAALLRQHAGPGGIVLGYETNALVQGLVETRALPAIAMKGITEPATPYAVVIPSSDAPLAAPIETCLAGMNLHLDPSRMDDAARDAARASLMAALRRLDRSG
jgi:class 3 adenylate cyclase